MADTQHPEAVAAAEAIWAYLEEQGIGVCPPDGMMPEETAAAAAIIAEKVAPLVERGYREGCEESKCPASSGHADHAWLHSAARAAAGGDKEKRDAK